MVAAFASSLPPAPASMSRVPHGPRTSRQRIAMRMRFRSSGGATFSQSTFGTTPNIAPPSSAKYPSSTGVSASSPTCSTGAPTSAPLLRVARLLQLDEHSVRRRGMHERDARAVCAGAGRLVDQPDAARLEPRQHGVEVVDEQRDVM